MLVNFVSLWMMSSMNQMFDAQTFLSISEIVLKINNDLFTEYKNIYIYIYIYVLTMWSM